MNIELADSYLFRNASELQEECVRRLEELALQMAPALEPAELEAAKALAAGAWRIMEVLFDAQGMELSLKFNTGSLIDSINGLTYS
ncbi:hypothetical protein [Lysobacter sp. Hz 25]|uniref:hypothetical protein n=1 Tax=Lysobacter sp. Hz 25 TaxID=3383698 RepID=UPI0038D40F4A